MSLRSTIFAFVYLLFLQSLVLGQHPAQVVVSGNGGVGQGVLIHVTGEVHNGWRLGYVVTAWHVTEEMNSGNISVEFSNGKSCSEVKVLSDSEDDDIAVIWVAVPDGIDPIPIAEEPLSPFQYLKMYGYEGREAEGQSADPTSDENVFWSGRLRKGDSGGPVVNRNGELVGTITGGWFWYKKKGHDHVWTWPARACNVDAVKAMLAAAIEKHKHRRR